MVLSDRDDKGRFKKGYKGGPGRPTREVEETYRAILVDEVSPDDWRLIIRKAKDQAKKGDVSARKFLADYIVGLPIQRQELTGEDGQSIRVMFEYADNGDEN